MVIWRRAKRSYCRFFRRGLRWKQVAAGQWPCGGAGAAALDLIRRGLDLVQHLDPAGVGARDLRQCLMLQIAAQQHEFSHMYGPGSEEIDVAAGADLHRSFREEAEAKIDERRRAMEVATLIVERHLPLLQKRDVKDLARAAQVTADEAHSAVEFIRTLDPQPGRMANREQTRLIEPDVFFVKRGGEWVVSMNEEDLPSLRLSQRYRRMLVFIRDRQGSKELR